MDMELDNHTTIGSIANIIRRTMRDYEIDIVPLLENADIKLVSLTEPDNRFSVLKMQSLWRLCAEATEDPCFGFKAGMQIQPSALHGLGFAWLASDTLRNALERLVKYSSLLSTFANLSLVHGEEETQLIFTGSIEVPDLVHESSDFYVVSVLRMCEITSPNSMKPKHIYMSRPVPPEILRRAFDKLTHCHMTFNCDDIRIVFDNETLDTPLTSPNPKLARMNDEIVEQYLSQYLSNSIRRQVTESIINYLPNGTPNADVVAASLLISRRTLQRKLASENTSFRQLLNDVRRQLAVKYIQHPTRALAETAYLLGFSEPSNFTRAFTSWFGQSPAKYRQDSLKQTKT